jgi:glycosyltransferase involved in cell wall biosynthesis
MERITLITSYFASPFHTNRAPYNEQLFLRIKALADVQMIRPIAWTDIARSQTKLKKRDYYSGQWNGIPVKYPTYYSIPRIGHMVNGLLYYWSILPAFRAQRTVPDVFFSSWAYPDSYAAMKLARRHNRPLVMSVLGSDINVLAARPDMRAKIIETLQYAGAILTPSNALSELVIGLGIAREKVHTVYCGIDDTRFYPRDRSECEQQLGLSGGKKRVIFVGNFKVAKGVIDYLKGVATLAKERTDFEALLVGKGEDDHLVRSAIHELDIESVVRYVGEVNHDQLNAWMNASDCLCLPSYAEGLPNVVLEALKTGISVVATDVGGIPEAVENSDECLFKPGDIPALASRLKAALFDPDYCSRPGFQIGSYEEMAQKVMGITRAVIQQFEGARTA